MKTAVVTTGVLFALQVLAFPAWLMNRGLEDSEVRRLAHIAAEIEMRHAESKTDLGERSSPGFDEASQFVPTHGEHAFIPPGPNDHRGPCPGLNSLANHGYIPRNGVGSVADFVDGTYKVFGMGKDLSTFLAIYGVVMVGDLTKWSIGTGPDGGLLGGLLGGIGLLGKPQGLIGSHNKYESDVSSTRGDLHIYGNAYKLQLSQFEDLYSQPMGDRGYDIPMLTDFRAKRRQQSVDNNPNLFIGAFAAVATQPAAYTFIYRFMANKSAEYPEGYLDSVSLKSFYAITGEPGNFEYTVGHERIPDDWYKRAIGDEYGFAEFLTDVAEAAIKYPEFLSLGGNTGETNTFTGINLGEFTNGVFNAETLLEGDNLGCFIFQVTQETSPDILKGLFGVLAQPLRLLNGAINSVLAPLTCPELAGVNTGLLGQFPGAAGSYKAAIDA